MCLAVVVLGSGFGFGLRKRGKGRRRTLVGIWRKKDGDYKVFIDGV